MDTSTFYFIGFVLACIAGFAVYRACKREPDSSFDRDKHWFAGGCFALFIGIWLALRPLFIASSLWTHVGIGAGTALFAFGFLYAFFRITEPSNESMRRVFGGAGLGMSVMLFTVTGGMAFTFASTDQALLSRADDGRILATYPSGRAIQLRNCENCILVPRVADFQSEVTPITPNPKARHIVLTVQAEIHDYAAYFRTTGLPAAITTSVETIDSVRFKFAVLREMKEFTNASSNDLAQFYNEFDEAQTQRLNKYVLEQVNPRLAPKGIRLVRLVSWTAN